MFGCLQVAYLCVCSVFANCICFRSRFRPKNLERKQAHQRSKICLGKRKVIENKIVFCFQCISFNLFIIKFICRIINCYKL